MLTRSCVHPQYVRHLSQQIHRPHSRSLLIAKAAMGAGPLWLSAAAMGVGAYGTGCLALISRSNKDSSSSERSPYMPALSAGLLMGAALAIVVPEGFKLQASLADDSAMLPEWAEGAALLLGFLAMVGLQVWADWDSQAHGGLHSYHGHSAITSAENPLLPEAGSEHMAADEEAPFRGASIPAGMGGNTTTAGESHARCSLQESVTESHVASHRARHSLEQQAATRPAPTTSRLRQGSSSGGGGGGSADEKEMLLQRNGSLDDELLGQAAEGLVQGEGTHAACHSAGHQGSSSSGGPGATNSNTRLGRPDQALVGLVAHSVADGLAVGAASLAGDLSVGLTVAMAIVLHKLPVAWSLASFLRVSQGTSKAHKGLLIFSAAAPVAAVAVHYLFSSLTWLTHPQTVSLCILASAGSVLHAGAVHVLPEVPPGPRWQGVMCAAALIPLLISMIPDG